MTSAPTERAETNRNETGGLGVRPYTSAAGLLAAIEPLVGGRQIHNPSTGAPVGRTPEHTAADLDSAVARALAAQTTWGALSHAERSDYLRRAADAIDASAAALAELLTLEQGKPLAGKNSRMEVGGSALWLRSTAALELEVELLSEAGGIRTEQHYRPLGVVGGITPWNFPMMISVWQIAPALRMGNTVVAKPSEHTPLSVLALVQVMNQVLPVDVLQAVAGGREVGEALSGHPDVAKIMFTGSTATGKSIIRSSAGNVKRLTLELGGNDAAIVRSDVDPAGIAEDLFWSAFANSGQVCAALKRLYVHSSIYDDVCAQLVEVASRVPMGDGFVEGNLLGPVQNRAQYDIVSRLVEAARNAGARILVGGNPDESQPGFFYPITLVADISNDNPLVTEEQFGPVLPIIRYDDDDEALEMANSSEAGLGASVWSNDAAAAKKMAIRLEAGTVWINRHGAVDPRIPFGGVKQSGYGIEFGVEGLKQLGASQIIRA